MGSNRSGWCSAVATILVTFMLAPRQVAAQVDTSEWLCEYCPFEQGYRATYAAGTTVVSDSDARYGNATGLDDDGAYLDLAGSGSYGGGGYRLDWDLEDLGLDSRAVSVAAGRPGSFGVTLRYRELPYRRFDSTETVFTGGAAGSLSLPPAWTPAGTTAGFAGLDTSLMPRDIGSDRSTVGLEAAWLPADDLRVFASYNRLTRDGIDIAAGPGYTQSSILPRPIDFLTDSVDIGVRYGAGRGSVSLAYFGSFFSNRDLALAWETPFVTVAGAQRLQTAQEPDNRFQQVTLSGAYSLPMRDTVVAFSLSSGQGVQHDTLLPYTVNPDVNAGALPRQTADGRVDTGNYALTLTTRPSEATRIKVAYRVDERDNNTAVSEWQRVIVDLFDSGDAERNTPYGYERSRFTLSGELRLRNDLAVSAGYDRTDMDRDYQEVASQTEDAGWGRVRWRPAEWLDVRARGGASNRDIGRYDTAVAEEAGQNPLLRKYNLAFRYRKFGELSAQVSLAKTALAFGATVFSADDSYSESQLGMTDSNELRYTLDLNWTVSDRLSAYLTTGSEAIDARQSGSERGGAADWWASHDDDFDHVGSGFAWRDANDKVDVSLAWDHGSGGTSISLRSHSGGDSRLPDLASSFDSLRLQGSYRWSPKLETTLELRYERFSTDDWALDGVGPDTLPTVLGLGADPYDYDIWAVGIGFRYRPGNHQLAPSK